MTAAQARAIRSGDAILRSDGAKATQADFGTRKAIVFIHGFTADASYMRSLMHQVNGSGFEPFAFEYACFRGIDVAANSLVSLLRAFDVAGAVSSNPIVLVGHSMGGLVARAAVSLFGASIYVRKVITLGTPNDGTLQDAIMPRIVAYWGEAISGLNISGFAARGISAKQLLKADPQPTLLDRLEQASLIGSHVQFVSISGGYAWLDFGKSLWKNVLINRYLQHKMSGLMNDGLVAEASSNLAQPGFATCAPKCIHDNSYVAYPHINHSYIVDNQEVAQRVCFHAR